jgi:thiamine biosynthesis lipoprotein
VATDTFEVFGTTAVLLVTAPAALPAARKIADRELAAVDQACSRFRPDSELTALNAADGAARQVSELFAALIGAALDAASLTGGATDPTCATALASLGYDRDFAQVLAAADGADQDRPAPVAASRPVPGWRQVELDTKRLRVRLHGGARLDLGATAKAWAADRCAARISEGLGCGVLVSLGGDLAAAGRAPGDGWRVRVTDDHASGPEAPGQTVAITGGGLATSSTTVRAWTVGGRAVHHIIDPATGQPASSCWRTVSVTAGRCADANAASTAAIVLGSAAPAWLASNGLPARLVAPDGTVQVTGGWPADSAAEQAADAAAGDATRPASGAAR